MINFNVLVSWFKNGNRKDEEINKDERLKQIKFMRRIKYIQARNPNFPNSDYIKLLSTKK